MIRIRYENVDPVIVDTVYEEYLYQIYNGKFEIAYWELAGPDEPPVPRRVGKEWNPHYDKIYLELVTPRWTRKYSFAESPAVLMTAMSDYETEINLETIMQEIDGKEYRYSDIYSHETEMKAIISDAVAKQLIEEIADD